jgi:anaphase-promoting complex subunit 4
MSLENNKAAHHIDVCPRSTAQITHIGWSQSNIRSPSLKLASNHLENEFSKEWTSGQNGKGGLASLSLPQELVYLEVLTALPKLSPLPSSSAGSGEDAIVFTIRTGIDFLFQSPKPEEYGYVNIMIVGTNDGRLHLSINDSFVVGSFRYPPTITSSSATLLLTPHFSRPLISTQSLLVAETAKQPREVHLLPMDLPFISSLPINVALLASKLTTLQKLLRYLKQTQLHMCVEWKNTRELHARFLRSVQGDLESMKRGPRDIVAALYHTVVTGHAHRPVRQWLVDSVSERVSLRTYRIPYDTSKHSIF